MPGRVGMVLAVANVERSTRFYCDSLGFELEALYDDPPYATLSLAGTRLSLAEQGHPADDRPGVALEVPADQSRTSALLVLEVNDARSEHARLSRLGVPFLADPYEPPWGGCRFFCVDPDGYLVEIEQPA
ncbi:MAG TPA: VOC family protein [Gaiellaceae bacterium]|nr:VOC family protein [Gaiellaceae bacterium]